MSDFSTGVVYIVRWVEQRETYKCQLKKEMLDILLWECFVRAICETQTDLSRLKTLPQD